MGWSAAVSTASSSSTSTKDGSGSGTPNPTGAQLASQQSELRKIQSRLDKLEAKAERSEKDNNAWKQSLTKDFRVFKDEVKYEVKTLETRYESSLQQALSKTENKLEASMKNAMDQLQQFIVSQNRQRKRQSPASPEKEDADMREARPE